MYAHKMALKVRANILAEKILNAQTTLELLELNKAIPRVEMSVEDQVVQMFHIQSQKFKNCQALRKKMRKLSKQKTIPCEATRNKFWGSGVDLSDLHRDTPDTPRVETFWDGFYAWCTRREKVISIGLLRTSPNL